jgi:hypothetical protein
METTPLQSGVVIRVPRHPSTVAKMLELESQLAGRTGTGDSRLKHLPLLWDQRDRGCTPNGRFVPGENAGSNRIGSRN